MALRMHFDNFGSIFDPVPVLLVSLDTDVKLIQEGLDISLILHG